MIMGSAKTTHTNTMGSIKATNAPTDFSYISRAAGIPSDPNRDNSFGKKTRDKETVGTSTMLATRMAGLYRVTDLGPSNNPSIQVSTFRSMVVLIFVPNVYLPY